jgi:hypothetical protein
MPEFPVVMVPERQIGASSRLVVEPVVFLWSLGSRKKAVGYFLQFHVRETAAAGR